MTNKDFKTKKSLGQNFLISDAVIDEIVEKSLCSKEDIVVEIGPGLGALTERLSKVSKRLYAVELDDRLIPILRAKFGMLDNVEIVHEDILNFDWSKVTGDSLRIVGNLPYYITTPILLGIMEKGVKAKSITVMVQKEVADRIVASPGGKEFGVLTASLGYYAQARKIVDVPRDCFKPVPNVDSAVVFMQLKDERPLNADEEKIYFALIKKAFSQRRKTLLNSLAGFNNMSKEKINSLLIDQGIDPQRRAETLSIEEYMNLSKEIKNA